MRSGCRSLDLKAEDNKNKAAICELNTKLQASEAGVETLKKQNTLLIKEKDAALVKAAGLQNDLDAAKKDMEENQKELEKARADATKFENDLKECEGLRDGLRSDLTHVKGDLLRVRKELAEAWEDNAKAGSLTEAEIAGYTRAGQISPSRLIELEGYEKKAKELETKLAAAEKVIIPIPAGKKLNILSVEYGGQAYQPGSKQAIIDKLYKHAADGTEFTITNDFFGGDPWHGQTKSFSITYLLEGENVVHHLYGLEKKSFRFCPNRK
ncbi:hypothetical protein BDV96DRAFT_40364 [Lophiotrema nucula]|uniref:Uncharacterized protein n=1 Tax=Lophiotrema nucula TaxID=690887 RepID=A0A6A5ZC60_9PLEO|nr:hypothetical protein BDV96DRAFT_40364 [Lophiotrema nucula]